MSEQDQLQQRLTEAKARGAVIINESEPGQGFAEDVTDRPEYESPAVLDAEKRALDAKPDSQIAEETIRLKEENSDSVRIFRMRHQDHYADWVPGKILWLGDFLRELQKIRPDAFYAEYSIRGLRGLGFVGESGPFYSGTSVMNGNMPEWSQLRLDEHHLPKNEKYRGWRTVLLACIRKGIVTEEDCDATFGKPIGPRAQWWKSQLWAIRNDKCGECRKQFCDCMDGYDYLRADKYQFTVPNEVAQGKQQRLG